MSKASPAVFTHTSGPSLVQPTYKVGEKVTFSWNGRALPCLVVATKQSKGAADNSGVVYVVQGDVTGTSYPAGAPKGPFQNVLLANLTDRS